MNNFKPLENVDRSSEQPQVGENLYYSINSFS